jgi:hypothetical protein
MPHSISTIHPHLLPRDSIVEIQGIPNGHWFFSVYDRFTCTPQPAKIVAERPDLGLVRPTEQELRQALIYIRDQSVPGKFFR